MKAINNYTLNNQIIVMLFLIILISCNNVQEGGIKEKDQDKNLTIQNNTGHNNLKIYFVRNFSLDSCTQLTYYKTVNYKENFTYHVPAGAIHTIYFCAPNDFFCDDCNSKIVKGKTTQETKISLQ